MDNRDLNENNENLSPEELLAKIKDMIDCPLVLHGGSGLSDDDFRRAIACGISKINIFTDINVACVKAAHDAYAEGKGMTDVMGAMSEAVKQATMKKMLLTCDFIWA